MATLVSAGVDVSIINESQYGSAGTGTIPLIVIATAANKASPSGSGVAPFTTASEAGQLKLIDSQRALNQGYGNPFFYSYQGTQLHGHELNEYGLHAAHGYLGYSSLAYVLRADFDTAALIPSDTAPVGDPVAGTFWLDTSASRFGIFLNNGNSNVGSAWESITPLIPTSTEVAMDSGYMAPISSFGVVGDYAVVTNDAANFVFEKINSSTWVRVGSSQWIAAHPTTVRSVVNPSGIPATSAITINGMAVTAPSTLNGIVNAINSRNIPNVSAEVDGMALVLTNSVGGNIDLGGAANLWSALGIAPRLYTGAKLHTTFDASYPTQYSAGDIWFKGTPAGKGSSFSVKLFTSAGAWTSVDAAQVSEDGYVAGTVGMVRVFVNTTTGARVLKRFAGGEWQELAYEAGPTAPVGVTPAGTYWYSTDYKVDIMVNDGMNWRGYREIYPETDASGVIISGAKPTFQVNGNSLVENDLWIDSTDTENYPALYRFNGTRWVSVDLTDQTTPNGIVFADARPGELAEYEGGDDGEVIEGPMMVQSVSSNGIDMLMSSYVDPDAPEPRNYANGILLFNTRYSTYNVKQWMPNYFLAGGFDPNTDYTLGGYTVGSDTIQFSPLSDAGRWVTASGNAPDGRAYMGRKAQRIMITRAMSAALANTESLRSEAVAFNLIACPGYPEMLDEMINLNSQMKETAFIVGDTPARLKPDATSIAAWAQNQRAALSNGDDGLTSSSEYAGIYYPWGLSTNVDGAEVMVPPSTIALRTIATNDQVGYQWTAPAGFARGIVENATSVGYLSAEEEFVPVILSQGQRDALYTNRINPIAFMPNRGLVVYGQKTLAAEATALDRINVARLTCYMKVQLDALVKPFLFAPNDSQTRDAARSTVERFLNGLVSQRALEDYAVVCNLDNNTAERRNRNELWIDIAVRPIKAVEFIYVPVRIQSSED